MSLIEDTALGSLKLSLAQPAERGLIAMLSARMRWAHSSSMSDINGETDFALSAREVAQAGLDQLLADEYRERVCDGAGVQAGGAPYLASAQAQREYGMTLRTQDGAPPA